MSTCVNKNDPRYKELLTKYTNPLVAEVKYKQLPSIEGQITSEKTIRDLAARMSDRIGMPVRFESDRTKEYKGKIENGKAYINLAYATLDTPIHEILGHPIIRAIKNKDFTIPSYVYVENTRNTLIKDSKDVFTVKGAKNSQEFGTKSFNTKEEAQKYADKLNQARKTNTTLYQNLLKELETGKGKEVLDRIKRDYQYKEGSGTVLTSEGGYQKSQVTVVKNNNGDYDVIDSIIGIIDSFKTFNEAKDFAGLKEYTLEEQQEEAIVELLGLMTAEKLDAVKDGKLISLLKRLLKEMKAFVRSLIGQKEIEIDKLPDNMTLGDLSDILAYSNSKLILPGYEVEYTTPDNEKFKTYQEASNHISELTKNVKDIDLDNIKLNQEIDIKNVSDIPVNEFVGTEGTKYVKKDNKWYRNDFYINYNTVEWDNAKSDIVKENELYNKYYNEYWDKQTPQRDIDILSEYNYRNASYNIDDDGNVYNSKSGKPLKDFIEKNKPYEQSKEIIEEWKKVNNIQYNPEEIYSRGQEFSSVVGAYSSFDVNLMMQNLLSHIEDNEKAGGKFAISAYTKPIDRQIGHLEGGGGKIKFKIYPQSEDILWAANTDVYSGSVWDASEKVNKDKKSELLGVSYTKYPSLNNVNSVQPNLASIVDDLAHHHNELGIVLTGNNFRLEYDDNIPYQTKKIIDGINKILDQKYGKLIKPNIETKNNLNLRNLNITYNDILDKWMFQRGINGSYINDFEFNTEKEALDFKNKNETFNIQPTQTKETLKETIDNIKNNNLGIVKRQLKLSDIKEGIGYKFDDSKNSLTYKNDNYVLTNYITGEITKQLTKEEVLEILPKIVEKEFQDNYKEKEYTNQALINTKISVLKEVAKKYPRSLIRSEVKPIIPFDTNSYTQFNDDLSFQKVPNKPIKEGVDKVFEEHPELVLSGTAQEYSDYLDTIFPESKVKDIVYHGAENKFDIFNTEEDGAYFAFNKNYAKEVTSEKIKNPVVLSVILDIKNPEEMPDEMESDGNRVYNIYKGTGESLNNPENRYLKQGIDAIIGYDFASNEKTIVVGKPEQIHILGSKGDIEGFKKYMEFKNNAKDYFNLSDEDSNFVSDISNINLTC